MIGVCLTLGAGAVIDSEWGTRNLAGIDKTEIREFWEKKIDEDCKLKMVYCRDSFDRLEKIERGIARSTSEAQGIIFAAAMVIGWPIWIFVGLMFVLFRIVRKRRGQHQAELIVKH